MELKGAGAVVTGGAAGIGLGIGAALARRGARVILADVEGDKAHAAADRLAAEGLEVSATRLDVTSEAEWSDLADLAWARLGSVELLFNNAGVGAGGTAHGSAQRTWDWVLGVNLHGVVNGVRAFAPRMLAGERPAQIVNTGSEHSLGLPESQRGGIAAAYTTSKHAVMGYSLCMRRDFEGTNLSVAILCPGLVRSEIWNAFRNRPATYGGPRQAPPELAAGNAAGLPAEVAGERVADQVEADAFFMFTSGDQEAQVFDAFSAECDAALAAFAGRYGPSGLSGV